MDDWLLIGFFDYSSAMSQKAGILRHEETLNPKLYTLETNPNPFNQTIDIRFKLKVEGQIKLAMYDITGREIAVLAEGYYLAGAHQVVWNASMVVSGMYFARLTAGDLTLTQKILLVK